jgi:hypothetical protein
MAKRESVDRSEIRDPSGRQAQRIGSAKKVAHHEGVAGAGPVSGSKFGKGSRDSVSEKEPGKSRGVEG